MKTRTLLVLLPFSLLAAACAGLSDGEQPKAQLTPLEIQSLQQRDLETPKATAFASVVSVFQDLGYTVTSADKETGFITAESLADSEGEESFSDIVIDTLFDIDDEYGVITTQTKATAFVEAFDADVTRVRLSFVRTKARSGPGGQNSAHDKQILDAEVYRNAFDKIENAIFVREGAMGPLLADR